ncbi:DUF1403 family protein [Pseudochrobactrum sp. MP213Fo]|uniref:DUF1403 family protein n=1 Tax=Pseudochrobactrum sp. MP213Fo TaxID=3022250 RepID=UPI003BA044FA
MCFIQKHYYRGITKMPITSNPEKVSSYNIHYRTHYFADRQCGYCDFTALNRTYVIYSAMKTGTTIYPQSPPNDLAPAWVLPSWVQAHAADPSIESATFAAAITLKTLDDLIRSHPVWAGCWRARQAMNCATAGLRLLGHQAEAALYAMRFCCAGRMLIRGPQEDCCCLARSGNAETKRFNTKRDRTGQSARSGAAYGCRHDR